MAVDFTPQIPFEMEDQLGEELCWIALAVSVKKHFAGRSSTRQCGLVKTLLEIPGICCTRENGVRVRCDKPGDVGDALAHPSVDHLARDTTTRPNPEDGGPMSFAQVKAQIDSNLPVCAFIEWPDNEIGHFILISGYHQSGGKRYVYVNDPLFGGGPTPYKRVVRNYNLEGGKWQSTYRLKR